MKALEEKAAAAGRRNESYASALIKLKADLAEHQAHVDKISSSDYQAMSQIEFADTDIAAMNLTMVTLVDFENALPHPRAIAKLLMQRQMHAQLSEAIGAFLERSNQSLAVAAQ
mgnify:CR=1 FL=1